VRISSTDDDASSFFRNRVTCVSMARPKTSALWTGAGASWVVRGFDTAVMHGGASAGFAVVSPRCCASRAVVAHDGLQGTEVACRSATSLAKALSISDAGVSASHCDNDHSLSSGSFALSLTGRRRPAFAAARAAIRRFDSAIRVCRVSAVM